MVRQQYCTLPTFYKITDLQTQRSVYIIGTDGVEIGVKEQWEKINDSFKNFLKKINPTEVIFERYNIFQKETVQSSFYTICQQQEHPPELQQLESITYQLALRMSRSTLFLFPVTLPLSESFLKKNPQWALTLAIIFFLCCKLFELWIVSLMIGTVWPIVLSFKPIIWPIILKPIMGLTCYLLLSLTGKGILSFFQYVPWISFLFKNQSHVRMRHSTWLEEKITPALGKITPALGRERSSIFIVDQSHLKAPSQQEKGPDKSLLCQIEQHDHLQYEKMSFIQEESAFTYRSVPGA
jgi:hypothetical protein